jgi:hypothetical protein
MEIYEKLNKIQSELKAPKGQYNKFGKYSYRSCEDILEALKPHLLKYGCVVTLTDDMQLIGDRYYLKATATITDAESGKSVSNVALAREDKERAGMSESQITGTASSYARKYALNGLFLIDDTKDADTDAYHEQTTGEKHKEEPKIAAATAKANEVKKLLVKISGDKTIAQQVWNEQYKQDAGDIVKMNAALIELNDKLKQIEAMSNDA